MEDMEDQNNEQEQVVGLLSEMNRRLAWVQWIMIVYAIILPAVTIFIAMVGHSLFQLG